jgi:hypothetical protein
MISETQGRISIPAKEEYETRENRGQKSLMATFRIQFSLNLKNLKISNSVHWFLRPAESPIKRGGSNA